MARKGRTKVIYKGTFISDRSLFTVTVKRIQDRSIISSSQNLKTNSLSIYMFCTSQHVYWNLISPKIIPFTVRCQGVKIKQVIWYFDRETGFNVIGLRQNLFRRPKLKGQEELVQIQHFIFQCGEPCVASDAHLAPRGQRQFGSKPSLNTQSCIKVQEAKAG